MTSQLLNIIFSENGRILVFSGTHGDPPSTEEQSGVSGLTDKTKLDNSFYFEDCKLVGVKPGASRALERLPMPAKDWERLPDITKPAEVVESPPPGSFYADEELKKMDIRVANMVYYYDYHDKLLDDISEVSMIYNNIIKKDLTNSNFPQFDPALMILSFCYSMNSDLSMLLRSRGVFGLMLVRHDLRLITEKSEAELNPVQRELLRQLGGSRSNLRLKIFI